jgi:SAM-dependent methyltransferase
MAQTHFKWPDTTLSALDLACGPGNLTCHLQNRLNEVFPDVQVKGLDLSAASVKRLQERTQGAIEGITGSFYEPPLAHNSQDIIFSNEGLHWQPPYPYGLSRFLYIFCQRSEYERYVDWSQTNLKQALTNIYHLLKPGGIAVIQMGRQYQLQQLWELMQQTIKETVPFSEFQDQIHLPLYYPSVTTIEKLLQQSGFSQGNYEIEAFSEDFVDASRSAYMADDVVNTLRAFTESTFSRLFSPSDVQNYYQTMRSKLNQCQDIYAQYVHNQWRRALIKLRKSPVVDTCRQYQADNSQI